MRGSNCHVANVVPHLYYIVIGYAMITHLRASEKQAKKTSSHDQTHDRRPPMITSTAGMAEIWRKRNSLCVGTKCPIATAVHAVWWWILAMIHRLAELPS